jgi:hypothetical protein
VLTKLVSERGAPAFLRSDNGPKSWCSNARDAQRDAGQELLRVTMVPEKLGSGGRTRSCLVPSECVGIGSVGAAVYAA